MFALTVHVRTVPAPTLVTVAGEIDMLTAPQLRDRVLPLPDDDVVLDRQRLVDRANVVVHALERKPLRRIQPVVVRLLE